MKVIDGLYYTEEHEWLKVEGNRAYIGITDFAQDTLGDVVFVELPEEDTELNLGDAFAVVESVKAASDVYTPISGKVTQVNQELSDQPELLNTDPYGSWMVVLEMDDQSELEDLMDAEEYQEFCDEEV
ncbi:MAG: glycine cleavage system protein GcvH [Clostridia bacterium]|nr:glycine cleavage system protein GcvH [Clostridia bacterium]